jgi:hypothetical protein
LAVVWRDALALLRNRSRMAWAVLLAAAPTYEILSHPGAALPAGVGAAALYFAASLLCEPLRVDIDHPDKSLLLLSWPLARLLVAHCTLPAAGLFTVAPATIVASVLTGVLAPACSP